MMSRINSWHRKISTGRHFQNGHHNIAKIQHCPISWKFDMWVDNDVPNWLPTLKNFYRSPFSNWSLQYRKNSTLWRPFWKWRPVEIVQCRESIRDIIIYPHIKFWWYRTMLNFCNIVTAILKMATGRNCVLKISGCLPFSKWLPKYGIKNWR
jgi:hypothetical protein